MLIGCVGNPYHRSSFYTVSDWIISKFKLIYRWNFLSALLEWRSRKLIRRYFQRHAFAASKYTYSYYDIDVIKRCTNVYLIVIVQNKYKNTLVGVLRTKITFVTHSTPSCYVTFCTQVIWLNSGNLGPQKTDSGVFIIGLCSGLRSRKCTRLHEALIIQYNKVHQIIAYCSAIVTSQSTCYTEQKLSGSRSWLQSRLWYGTQSRSCTRLHGTFIVYTGQHFSIQIAI